MMVANFWCSFSQAASENLADIAIAAEARLAHETFRRDFSGCLPGVNTGTRTLGRCVGRLRPQGDYLMLCFDGSPVNQIADWNSPDTVVEYTLENGQLLRSDNQSDTVLVVADGVMEFTVTEHSDGLTLELTLERQDLSRTYTWRTQDP